MPLTGLHKNCTNNPCAVFVQFSYIAFIHFCFTFATEIGAV